MELEETLAEAIQKAVKAAESGGEFLQGQLPDYIQQLLLWAVLDNLIGLFVMAAFFVASVYALRYCLARLDDDEGWAFGVALSVIVGTVSFLVSLGCITTVLQIWIAPKVYLIEYAAKLVS